MNAKVIKHLQGIVHLILYRPDYQV